MGERHKHSHWGFYETAGIVKIFVFTFVLEPLAKFLGSTDEFLSETAPATLQIEPDPCPLFVRHTHEIERKMRKRHGKFTKKTQVWKDVKIAPSRKKY